MNKELELYNAHLEIQTREYDLNVNPEPKIVTLKKVKYNPTTGNFEDVTVKNMAMKKKEVDDFISSAKTITAIPYGFYQNDNSEWKCKLTRIGKLNIFGSIDFLLYAKGDYNYSKNIAIRVTLSSYIDSRIEVSIKPLHENDALFISALYSIHIDKDGYFWIGVSAVFTSHIFTQLIVNRNSILTMDEVKTYEELTDIGGEILPITEITTQTYEARVENYVA